MSTPDVLQLLGDAWPARRRGLLGSLPPSKATDDVASAVRRAAAAGEHWIFALLYLAGESDGALRRLLLDEIAATLAALPARRWYRLDALARPGFGYDPTTRLSPTRSAPATPVLESIRDGLRRWNDCSSLESIRSQLGLHIAPLLLAALHRSGRVREAAVGAVAGDVRALPVLLVRANDWVPAVRERARTSLRGLVDPTHGAAWLAALPLLVRLDICGRTSHTSLLDEVGALLRSDAARSLLLDAVRGPDAAEARTAAPMVARAFGTSDRGAVAALLACPDTLVRIRAIDAYADALDEGLIDVALDDPVAMVRRRALDAVRERDTDQFARRIRAACFDRSAGVREYAAFYSRRLGTYDLPALTAEAVRRLSAPSGSVLGPLAFLCDLEGDEHIATIHRFADHPSGRVRLCAKRRMIRSHRPLTPLDPRLLDDPSPKVARRLVELLRARGEPPDWPRVARRFEESSDPDEACAWLETLTRNRIWEALPHLVRALDDDRTAVARRARGLIDATTGRTFRGYVHPEETALRELASALGACRDARATEVTTWVRAVTGRKEWPETS